MNVVSPSEVGCMVYFAGRDATYTAHFYHFVHIIWYLCVMNFDLVGGSYLSEILLYFVVG